MKELKMEVESARGYVHIRYAKQVPYSFILLLPYRIRYLLMYMYQNIPKQTTADIIACL